MTRNLVSTTAVALLLALPAFAEDSGKNPFTGDAFFTSETTVEDVQKAIDAGHDINEEDEYGGDALIHAIDAGASIEVLQFLVDQGAELDQPDPSRHRAVQAAAWSAKAYENLSFLREAGADMTARDYMQETWFHNVIWGEEFDPRLIELAKEVGLDISEPNRCNNTALTGTGWASHDARKWYDALAAEGLDPTIINCEGMDIYMKSISWGDGAMSEFLYDVSEDPQAADNAGLSGILLAAQWGVNKTRLEFLKSKGYDLTITSPKGENALILNMKWGDKESVQLLLDEGFDVNSVSNDGTTPLLMSMRKGTGFDPEAVTALIEADADIGLANNKGQTPIMLLLAIDPAKAKAGADKVAGLMSLMLDKGAELNATDAGGATTLIYAVKGGQPSSVLKQILEAGVDVNATDAEGSTALMYAAELSDDPAVIDLLLEAGADKTLMDVFEDTAAVIAMDNASFDGTEVIAKLQ